MANKNWNFLFKINLKTTISSSVMTYIKKREIYTLYLKRKIERIYNKIDSSMYICSEGLTYMYAMHSFSFTYVIQSMKVRRYAKTKAKENEMKEKQCEWTRKEDLDIVTSSLFDGRNIKYHHVLLFLPTVKCYEQKKTRENGVYELLVSCSSPLSRRKKGGRKRRALVLALAFIYHHLHMIHIYMYECVRRADFLSFSFSCP